MDRLMPNNEINKQVGEGLAPPVKPIRRTLFGVTLVR